MDSDNKRFFIKNRRVEMRKMHDVNLLLLNRSQKLKLLGERIMSRVDQNFLNILALGFKTLISGRIHEKYILVFIINFQ
ncbi:MAG: hypothetical protein ACD_65C00326G0002 [uncultured bacterium]|nr:MAG: hypothetical protein ACD_65C00326G0002 [uncultured bacterium]